MELPVIVILVAFAVIAQGSPIMENHNDLVNAALARNWDELHRLLEKYSNNRFQISPVSSGEVRDLKPVSNGRFYAESESSFHHSVNDNGKVQEQSGGHMVINNNGQVKEYDFQPKAPAYS